MKLSRSMLYVLMIVLISGFCYSQTILPVSHLRQNDVNGVSQDTGQTITIKGIVTVGNEFNSPSYVQDTTGGVAVYGRGATAFSGMVKIGDVVQLTGKVVNYNGLTEFNPVNSFTKLDSGKTVVPQTLTIPQIVNQAWNGFEAYEGKLIKISNVTLKTAVTTWAGNTNYTIQNGTDTLAIRITTGTNLVGAAAPTGAFDITGVLSQYKTSAPYNSGYQFMPRFITDISTAVPASISVTSPAGAENWLVGSVHNITWTSTGVQNLKIEYSYDNGSIWIQLASGIAASTGTYSWTIPNTPSANCKVRITDLSNGTVFGISAAVFSITTGTTVLPISHLHNNDFNGVSLDTGQVLTFQGVVSVGNEFNSPSYLQDTTAGVAVYGRGATAFSGLVKIGDVIQFTGKVVNYNGLTEINPVSSFTKLDSGKTVTPQVLTIPQVVNQTWNGFEAYEGKLIKIKNVTLTTAVTAWAGNTNYTIKNGTDTLAIRITTGTTLVGQTVPAGAFDITGVLSQYKTTAPYSSGYQLMPRIITDVTSSVTSVISITAPNGGEIWPVGTTQNITWTSTGVQNVKIEYSADNGLTWTVIAASQSAAAGTYAWLIPNIPSTQCKVKISDVNAPTVFGVSASVFTIGTAANILPISHLRQNDLNGVSQDTGQVVTIKGIVSVGNEFNSPSYIQDTSGGVAVFGRGATAFSGLVKIGDVVQLTGKVVNYLGLTEINPVNSFTRLDSGKIVNPLIVTIPQVVNQTWNGFEAYESRLIKIKNVTVLNPPAVWAGNTNYTLKNGTDTLAIRIATGTTLVGQPVPTTAFDVVGVLSQYKTAAPFSTGYQLMPRFTADIITTPNPTVTWSANIRVSDAATEKSNQVLTFGAAPNATDGIDASLGEASLPPVPPAGVFDARFILPVTPAENSVKDFRNDTLRNATWQFSFQPGTAGYPFTLVWDSTALPQGSFQLKDIVTGTLINVNMKQQGRLQITNTGIASLKIVYSKEVCKDISVNNGWNIVSIPVHLNDSLITPWFPLATSPAYSYNGGYVTSQYVLSPGKGFWIRYPQAAVITMCGRSVTVNTVPLLSGWNLIGVYENEVPVSGLTTTPAGILNSSFYGYNNGYIQPTTLIPGKGYWIRTSAAGSLNLVSKAGANTLAKTEYGTGKITIRDFAGNSAALFTLASTSGLNSYDLPPMPPAGIFDVRYSTQRNAEELTSATKQIVISGAVYPVEIHVEGLNLKISDAVTGKIVNSVIQGNGVIRIDNPEIHVLNIQSAEKPLSFELSQNYPNPFNPSTSISFSVPENGKVMLTVYNHLGEKVTELANSEMNAGTYTISWNAKNLSSGVYFYELSAGKFRSVKKLILMK